LSQLQISGFLNYQFDYPKRLLMKNMYGNLYERSSILLGQQKQTRQGKSKEFLQKQIIKYYGENKQAGLLLGMLIGDRSLIPKQDYQSFVSSGLVHIIAVSGGNIIMLVVFLSAILFFLPFYLRNVVLILAVLAYASICGMDSSVVRASITGVLGLFVLFW